MIAPFHSAVGPNPQRDAAPGRYVRLVVVVGAHHNRVLHLHAAGDLGAQANDAVADDSFLDLAAICQQDIVQRGAIDDRAGQVAWPGVNWKRGSEKLKGESGRARLRLVS